jgi:hypothetical protein
MIKQATHYYAQVSVQLDHQSINRYICEIENSHIYTAVEKEKKPENEKMAT